MRSRTAGKAFAAEVILGSEMGAIGCPAFAGRDKGKSPAQDASQRAAHNRAADRVAHRSADRLSQIADNLPGDAIGDRPGDLARDELAGRKAIAAWIVGPEDRAKHSADLADDAALLRRARPAGRPTLLTRRRGRSAVRALLQHFVGGFGIHRLVVFALHRALPDDGGPLLRAD